MTNLEFMRHLHKQCHFQTREGKRAGVASGSELRRWFDNGAVVINGVKAKHDDFVDFPIKSFILFPKNPITLF